MNKKKNTLYRFLSAYGFIWLFTPVALMMLFVNLSHQVQAATPAARIAYWQLDETTGPPYVDSINAYNGVCAGSCPTADTAGLVNGGQAFDGVGNGITVTAVSAFNWGAADSFSIEFWVKAAPGQTCASADQVMIGRADSGAGAGFWSLGCTGSAGTANFRLGDSTGSSVTLESAKVITNGVWHHIVGIRDGANKVNSLYVDGTEVMSATQTYSGGFAPGTADISLGYLESGAYFEGTLDEVAVYTGVLSAAEIQTHYYLSRDYADACATPVKIMPLGDSITRGSGTNPIVGYRQPLYLDLVNGFYSIDFVGSQNTGTTATPAFGTHHEGHSGWHADDTVTTQSIQDNIYNFLSNKPADVVLLQAGTNDVLGGQDAASLVPEIGLILDEIDRYDESITVIVAQITNLYPISSTITTFNAGLVPMVAARVAAGDKIILVDNENALTYPDDLTGDGIHPNSTGYGKISNVWLAALNQFMPLCNPLLEAPVITSSAVTEVGLGQSYLYTVTASGYPTPTYTLTTAPIDMAIMTETGSISWNPASSGSFGVTVEASNVVGVDPQSFTITVTEAPAITSTPVTAVTLGQSYSYDVDASGYPTPTFSLPTKPTGMTIDTNTGVISWTPGATGDYAVTVSANNSAGTTPQNFTVTVTEAPAITSTPVTAVNLGQAYSYDVDASGYPTPTYTLTTAPEGMTIITSTGVISWTPVTTGDFSVTVTADNAAGTSPQNFTITVTQAPAITSTPVTTVNLGQSYSYDVDASGYPTPTYALTTAPAGMTIITDTGVISWLPGMTGMFSVTVSADNSVGTISQSFDVTVTEEPAITSTPVTAVNLGQVYNYDVDASGYPTPTFSLTAKPTGMTIDTNTGIISWTPGATGDYAVTVSANNSAGTTSQNFTVTVTEAPAITSTPVTTVGVGQTYTYDVDATGYPTPTFSLTAKPTGMTIDADTGVITWTPGTTGVFTVTVQASNMIAASASGAAVSQSGHVVNGRYPIPPPALLGLPAAMTVDLPTIAPWSLSADGLIPAMSAVGELSPGTAVQSFTITVNQFTVFLPLVIR